MKVVFSHSIPFALAHGGSQTLIEALMSGLARCGVSVEPERWWDAAQEGDILHYVGRPLGLQVILARAKGRRVVMTELLDSTAARSGAQRALQRALIRVVRRTLPQFTGRLGWDAYALLDALVFATDWERQVAHRLFDAPLDRMHVIPHGLEAAALAALRQDAPAGDYLVSVATIHPRKNSVLLARAARAAGVPVVFIGKPYAENDPYFREFASLMDGQLLRRVGFVSEEEKQRWLRGARGFALLSRFESGCIAVYEAAAAGLPLCLTDAPWARTYPATGRITRIRTGPPAKVGRALQTFYAQARRQSTPSFPVQSWDDVARAYCRVYERVLGGG